MPDNVVDVIVDLLERGGPVPGDGEPARRNYRYLDAGHVSSFEIISYILELEEHFDIRFSPEDTQSDAFRTVGGLADMIESKRNSTASP
jgi:acyl carrier protein